MWKATQAGPVLAAHTASGVTTAPPASAPATPLPRPPRTAEDEWIDLVKRRVLAGTPEFDKYAPGDVALSAEVKDAPANFLFAAEDDPHDPDVVFHRLRWGGQFVYVSRDRSRVAALPERYTQRGFEVVRPPACVRRGPFGLQARWLARLFGRKVHFFIARKVALTLPREISERFTYHVRLIRETQVHDPAAGTTAHAPPDATHGGYVVLKEVPSVERVSARLRHKFPDAAEDLIRKRALKFTEKIFPLFLTREAAMLKILERDLPIAYRDRVPRLIRMEQDERGYVRRMWMNWLRARTPAGEPLTQLEFARQAADLLRVLHDEANVIHLDLRLDNVVITDRGVGFVDFGSAVREGENIKGNPMLATIFDELMRTSQIQRMLEKMMTEGAVTSHILNQAHGKVDKGVDLFYLAVSINHPLANPDFRGLVESDPSSGEAIGLGMVTEDVLKPRDPTNPPVRSAKDLLRSVEGLAFSLKARRRAGE